MSLTFAALQEYLQKTSPHQSASGRSSKYSIPNMINRGQHLFWTTDTAAEDEGTDADATGDVALEDVMVEVGL